jgi:hypothetical protein
MLLSRGPTLLGRSGGPGTLCAYALRAQQTRTPKLPALEPLRRGFAADGGAAPPAPVLRSVLVRATAAAAAAAEAAARPSTFAELGLGDGLQAGLAGSSITRPTEIQARGGRWRAVGVRRGRDAPGAGPLHRVSGSGEQRRMRRRALARGRSRQRRRAGAWQPPPWRAPPTSHARAGPP